MASRIALTSVSVTDDFKLMTKSPLSAIPPDVESTPVGAPSSVNLSPA